MHHATVDMPTNLFHDNHMRISSFKSSLGNGPFFIGLGLYVILLSLRRLANLSEEQYTSVPYATSSFGRPLRRHWYQPGIDIRLQGCHSYRELRLRSKVPIRVTMW